MKDFPDSIIKSIFFLKKRYNKRRCFVSAEYPLITIFKYSRDNKKERMVSLQLKYFPKSGIFEIQPLDTIYVNKISHFDYLNPERRLVRNKSLIISYVNDLKKCKLWDKVINKDFLIVNTQNNKIDVQQRIELLNKLMGE